MEFAEACAEQMGRNGSIIGTTFTARDMARIADALDEDGLLNYWGISYGTYLGTVFASLFPDMVGNFLLDSNVNPYEWRAGSQLSATEDGDKAFMGFLTECVKAPENCAFAKFAPNGEPEELRELYNSIADISPEGYDKLKVLTASTLYDPSSWSLAADILVQMYFSNATSGNSSFIPTGDDKGTASLPQYNKGINAVQGITCADSDWRTASPEQMLPIVELQQNVSSFADLALPQLSWPCTVWKIPIAETYRGKFGSETRNPMLIANGIYDPITPLSAARNVSAAFDGSVVLQHNGYGHGVNSHPSLCTGMAIKKFFESGELPEEGTVCEPDVGPFALERDSDIDDLLSGSPVAKRNEEGTYTQDDVKLLKAMRELGKRQRSFEKFWEV